MKKSGEVYVVSGGSETVAERKSIAAAPSKALRESGAENEHAPNPAVVRFGAFSFRAGSIQESASRRGVETACANANA